MFYINIAAIIGCISLINIFDKRKFDNLFIFLSILITIICSIRYGGGTDYFAYGWHFYQIPPNIIKAINYDSHIDVGFRFIISIFRMLNLNYEVFICIISIFMLLCYIHVINNYSENKILSLFVLFCSYYLIYIESALRQGLVMSIFIVAFYKYINDNNLKSYIIIMLISSLIHKVALISLIVPIIKVIYTKVGNSKKINIIILLFSVFMFLIKGDVLLVNIVKYIGINIPYVTGEYSVLAILVRVILFSILYISYKLSDEEKISDIDKFQVYLYFINTCIFIILSNNQTLSRIYDFISIIEIIVLVNFVTKIKNKIINTLILIVYMSILSTLFLKDLNANIYQGNYYKAGILNYPYVTIFDKDKIFEYRNVEEIYKNSMYDK